MKPGLKDLICNISSEVGFCDIKFCSVESLIDSEQNFLEWRNQGFAADMNYLLRENPINARPQELLKEAKTMIMFSAHYHSICPPRPSEEHGRIASYAVGLDYHKILKKKITELINHNELKNHFAKSKFFTDSVPLLEKSFARKSGLGFRGRNTLIISRETGSFNFILEILTDLDIEVDQIEHTASKLPSCGNCVRCLDVCPTQALPEPYKLDARKCISYHTIENKGEIPEELSKNFGEWFFGCDLCQTICPYNSTNKLSKNQITVFEEFRPESGFGHWIYLPEILDLEEARHSNFGSLLTALEKHKFIRDNDFKTIKKKFEHNLNTSPETEDLDYIFQTKFAQTALLRPKRLGLIRNAKIVLANL